MKLTEILKLENILLDFKGNSKIEILNEIIDSLSNDSRVLDIDVVRQVVLDREKIMSTGVGSGFAIPHGKTNLVSELVGGFALLKSPIEFDSFDNEPVNIIFLLVGREDRVGQHLKVLSRISRIMNQAEIRTKLLNANTAEEILQILDEEDEKYIELS
jgi:mannitol/fructose-specific phosphotransferase system IIA component (Ntr-type)